MKRTKESLLCLAALIVSNLIFGLVPAIQKITFAYGGNGMLTGFYTSAIALCPLIFMARKNNISLIPDKSLIPKLIILSSTSTFTTILLWSSYGYIPVGVATTLHYIYPMLIALSMTLFFREKFFWNNGIALLLAMCGVALIGIADMSHGNIYGIVLALMSGCTWAFYIIYIQRSGLSESPTCFVNFYIVFMNMVVSFISCIVTKQLNLYTVWWAWLLIVGISLLHRVIAYSLFQMGMRKIEPVSAGILCTFEPMSALVFGLLFLHETINTKQTLGLLCVSFGVIINLYSNNTERK